MGRPTENRLKGRFIDWKGVVDHNVDRRPVLEKLEGIDAVVAERLEEEWIDSECQVRCAALSHQQLLKACEKAQGSDQPGVPKAGAWHNIVSLEVLMQQVRRL